MPRLSTGSFVRTWSLEPGPLPPATPALPGGAPRSPQPKRGASRTPLAAPGRVDTQLTRSVDEYDPGASAPARTLASLWPDLRPVRKQDAGRLEAVRAEVAKRGGRDVWDVLKPYVVALERDAAGVARLELSSRVLSDRALAPATSRFEGLVSPVLRLLGLERGDPTLEAAEVIYPRTDKRSGPHLRMTEGGRLNLPLEVALSLARNRRLGSGELRGLVGSNVVLEHTHGRDEVHLPIAPIIPKVARFLTPRADDGSPLPPRRPEDVSVEEVYLATRAMLAERLFDEHETADVAIQDPSSGKTVRFDPEKGRWFQWDARRRRRGAPASRPSLEAARLVIRFDQIDELLGKVTDESPAAKLEVGPALAHALVPRSAPGDHAELERLTADLAGIALSWLVYAFRPGNLHDLAAILGEANLRDPRGFADLLSKCGADEPIEKVYVGGLGLDGAEYLHTENSAEAVVSYTKPAEGQALRFFVSVKGTRVDGRDFQDILTDLDFFMTQDVFTAPDAIDPQRRVHRGFQQQALALFPALEASFARIAEQHGQKVEDCEFSLTGHSLGAALVELLSTRLIVEGRAVKVALMQAKPLVGNGAYKAFVENTVETRAPKDARVQRVFVHGDPVGDQPRWMERLQGAGHPAPSFPGFEVRGYSPFTQLGVAGGVAGIAALLRRNLGIGTFFADRIDAHLLHTHKIGVLQETIDHLHARYGVDLRGRGVVKVEDVLRAASAVMDRAHSHSTVAGGLDEMS